MVYNSFKFEREIKKLKCKYPIIEYESIGKNILNKDIICIKIGKGKRKIFYSGAIHANEWITCILLLKFIKEYCNAYYKNEKIKNISINEIFNLTTLYIVPMVNPDGVDLVNRSIHKSSDEYQKVLCISKKFPEIIFPNGWKANIRGVDLKNFQLLFIACKYCVCRYFTFSF